MLNKGPAKLSRVGETPQGAVNFHEEGGSGGPGKWNKEPA